MKFVFPILMLVFVLETRAASLRSRIHSIDVAPEKGVPHLIMLENGSVVFLDYREMKILQTFQESLKQHDLLDVEVNSKNQFISAETVEEDSQIPGERVSPRNFSYDPSDVSSSTASAVFYRMRRDYQYESQCYNRAHVWAYEEYKKTGLKSKKTFLFFTRRYIRNYNYKWWFHVSPSTVVNGTDMILDRRYTSGPRTFNSWTRNFIYSGRTCPVVEKYYDYRNNQESQDCYLIPVSMYFCNRGILNGEIAPAMRKPSFIRVK